MGKIGRFLRVLFFLTFFSGILLFLVYLKVKPSVKMGTDFDEYKAEKGVVIREIPKQGKDIKYMFSHGGLRRVDMYAFTLDGVGYQEFVNECMEVYSVDPNKKDENKPYGYDYWYNMKVGDINKELYKLDEFPKYLKFKEVIDDDIGEYKVIVYDPKGSFTTGFGIVGNPKTGRVVCYSEGTLR